MSAMFGWVNPFPMVLGGGPADVEQIWAALRAAEGGERGPGPKGGIEDMARQVEAQALAGADRGIERAFFQAFPGLATDALTLWEALLQGDGADTPVALRALLAEMRRKLRGTTTPRLAQALLDISEKLSIDLEDVDTTDVTAPGKYLAPLDDDPPYGDESAAFHPNHASRDVLRVVYALDEDEPGIPDEVSRAVRKMLQKRLPTHQTWTLVQVSAANGSAFLLDGGEDGTSVLDVTPMG